MFYIPLNAPAHTHCLLVKSHLGSPDHQYDREILEFVLNQASFKQHGLIEMGQLEAIELLYSKYWKEFKHWKQDLLALKLYLS